MKNPEEIALKMAEDGTKMSEVFNMSLSNGKLGKFECLDDRSNEDTRVMRFELMDNAELYNGIRFPVEALQHQVDVFNEKNFLVTHGMDHSGNVRDQLGKVIEMEIEKNGELATIYIVSEHYKETPAQKDAETLYQQGLLDSISGGWRCGIAWNDETEEFEVYKPILREVSSTPIPAKKDATVIENVCMALKNYSPKTMKKDEQKMTDQIPKEELEMEKENDIPEPSDEGKVEHSAELIALNKRMDARDAEFAEMKESQEAAIKESLMEKASKLGLSEESFVDKTPEQIQFALEVAEKVKMSTLRENNPGIPLGEDGQEIDGESPEMQDYLFKNIYRVDSMGQ